MKLYKYMVGWRSLGVLNGGQKISRILRETAMRLITPERQKNVRV